MRYLLAKKSAKDEADRQEQYKELHRIYAPVVRRLIGDLRGMFTKAAQVASVVPQLLPEEYQREFKKLQDTVPPTCWKDIRRVLEQDLGAPVPALFDHIDTRPLGAASLGQAHLVTWKGRRVVVKVQYPESADNIRADFDSLQALCRLTNPMALPMLKKIRAQFEKELNYAQEARHMRCLHDALLTSEFAGKVVVPKPIDELTRGRVLGMEYIPGPKLDDVLHERLRALGAFGANASSFQGTLAQSIGLLESQGTSSPSSKASVMAIPPIQRAGAMVTQMVTNLLGTERMLRVVRFAAEARLRCRRRAFGGLRGASTAELRATLQTLLQVYGYQIFFCPVFNADPHPGNLLAQPDGRVGLIDWGQCIEFDPNLKVHFSRLVVLLSTSSSKDQDADDQVADLLIKLGVRTETSDREYMAFVARLMFCRMEVKWFRDDFLGKMMQRDRIIEQPLALFLVSRTANLLRGFGFKLFENVSLADAWRPFAERWLTERGLSVSI